MSGDYVLSRRFTVFFNLSNLNDEPVVNEIAGPATPDYARIQQYERICRFEPRRGAESAPSLFKGRDGIGRAASPFAAAVPTAANRQMHPSNTSAGARSGLSG